MYVYHLFGALSKEDRHAPQHGVIGYRSPKCPPGHSIEFSRMSRITHVTNRSLDECKLFIHLYDLIKPVMIIQFSVALHVFYLTLICNDLKI